MTMMKASLGLHFEKEKAYNVCTKHCILMIYFNNTYGLDLNRKTLQVPKVRQLMTGKAKT